jgi:hypothetical protein
MVGGGHIIKKKIRKPIFFFFRNERLMLIKAYTDYYDAQQCDLSAMFINRNNFYTRRPDVKPDIFETSAFYEAHIEQCCRAQVIHYEYMRDRSSSSYINPCATRTADILVRRLESRRTDQRVLVEPVGNTGD